MERVARLALLIVAMMGFAPGAVVSAGADEGNAPYTSIVANARGVTIPLPNGTFKLVGVFTADDGMVGTYAGEYVEETTGYTSCLDTFGGSGPSCWVTPPPRCNRVIGEITFRFRGETAHFLIRNGATSATWRFRSGVCLGVADPSVHGVDLWLIHSLVQFSQDPRGYMHGTSRPLGGGVYADDFSLRLESLA